MRPYPNSWFIREQLLPQCFGRPLCSKTWNVNRTFKNHQSNLFPIVSITTSNRPSRVALTKTTKFPWWKMFYWKPSVLTIFTNVYLSLHGFRSLHRFSESLLDYPNGLLVYKFTWAKSLWYEIGTTQADWWAYVTIGFTRFYPSNHNCHVAVGSKREGTVSFSVLATLAHQLARSDCSSSWLLIGGFPIKAYPRIRTLQRTTACQRARPPYRWWTAKKWSSLLRQKRS